MQAILFMGVFLLFSFSQQSSAENDSIQAQWESQQIRYRYQAFYTFYTCAGLEQKLKDLLHAIGARKDARVEVNCFGSFNEVQGFADVLLAFAIPVYAGDKTSTGIADEVFPASLEEVVINRRRPRYLESGDCDLVDDFRRQVVEKLGIAVVDKRLSCTYGRTGFFAPTMKLKILVPDKPGSTDEAQSE